MIDVLQESACKLMIWPLYLMEPSCLSFFLYTHSVPVSWHPSCMKNKVFLQDPCLINFIASFPLLACSHCWLWSALRPSTASQNVVGSPCYVIRSVLKTKWTPFVFSLPSLPVSIPVALSIDGFDVRFQVESNFLISQSSFSAFALLASGLIPQRLLCCIPFISNYQ